MPVRFEPGRARLGTNPTPTGSFTRANTMGIVVVVLVAVRHGQTGVEFCVGLFFSSVVLDLVSVPQMDLFVAFGRELFAI